MTSAWRSDHNEADSISDGSATVARKLTRIQHLTRMLFLLRTLPDVPDTAVAHGLVVCEVDTGRNAGDDTSSFIYKGGGGSSGGSHGE